MILAGVDLAWQSNKNPTAIAYGRLRDRALVVTSVDPVVYGIENVLSSLRNIDGLEGVAIDAPLIIKNSSGQRPCETQIGKVYGSRGASCHTSNTSLYPNAKSVDLSEQLAESGFNHLKGNNWQIECYPHPTIIEIFELPKRLKYKKGRVSEKRAGQNDLAALLRKLCGSRVLRLVLDDIDDQILNASYIDSLRGKTLKSNEDVLDALICLYTAGLYAIDYVGQVYGDVNSGYVWIPHGVCIKKY